MAAAFYISRVKQIFVRMVCALLLYLDCLELRQIGHTEHHKVFCIALGDNLGDKFTFKRNKGLWLQDFVHLSWLEFEVADSDVTVKVLGSERHRLLRVLVHIVVVLAINDLLSPDLLVPRLYLIPALLFIPVVSPDPLVNLDIAMQHKAFTCCKLELVISGRVGKLQRTLRKN